MLCRHFSHQDITRKRWKLQHQQLHFTSSTLQVCCARIPCQMFSNSAPRFVCYCEVSCICRPKAEGNKGSTEDCSLMFQWELNVAQSFIGFIMQLNIQIQWCSAAGTLLAQLMLSRAVQKKRAKLGVQHRVHSSAESWANNTNTTTESQSHWVASVYGLPSFCLSFVAGLTNTLLFLSFPSCTEISYTVVFLTVVIIRGKLEH